MARPYVVVITPPAPLVDLATAKAHLRVEDNESDALIETYIAAASAHIDGPNGWLGRAIGPQTLEARFDRFACDLLQVPYGPLVSITSVKYDDLDGVEQTLAADAYSLDQYGALVAYNGSWPSARLRSGSVRVRYEAGYAAVPAPITAAVLLMVGDLYSRRETTGTDGAAVQMSTTVEALLSPYRVWSV